MTNVFLVRHGVTEHTGKKLSGWMEGLHLTDDGRRQAQEAADQLAQVHFNAIYTSPIDRCRETAQIIAGRHHKEVVLEDGIGEVGYGGWTDRSFKSLTRTKLWELVQRRPSAARFPEGESLREVQARAVDTVELLAAKHPKQTICCVSHADVIKLVLAHYLGVHLDLFQRIGIGPASVSALSLEGPSVHVWAVNVLPRFPTFEPPPRRRTSRVTRGSDT